MNKSLLALKSLLLFGTICFAQQNVGIGTLSPNPKAMLDVSSSDKGFLLPRMTTTQRNNIGAAGAADIGLIVYDTNDNLYYFWDGTNWKYFPQKPGDDGWIVSGNYIYSTTGDSVGIGVTNPSAKFHVLGSVRLANLGSTTTNLDVLTVDGNGNVRTRQIPSDIWDGDSVNDADSNPSNECISSIVFDPGTRRLLVQEGCGQVISDPLPINPNDNDADSTNELQNLSSRTVGSVVYIDISRNGTSASFDNNDADANPTNEAQTLSITKTGTTVNWSLTSVSGTGGGTGSFSLDDNDWTGAGTGSMYTSSNSDNVGIGTSSPTQKLDVSGSIITNDKLYLKSTSYYLQNIDTSLQVFSNTNIKLQTGKGHLTTYNHSGSEAFVNYNLNGQDVMTLRGNGSYDYNVGIGTQTPADKLQVAGNVRVGLINTLTGSNNALYFSGGQVYAGGVNSDNKDPLFISRYNNSADASELRIGIGDDESSANSLADRLSIGALSNGSTDLGTFYGLFDFEIENPGTSNGPMLSINPTFLSGNVAVKTYNGGLAITKPVSAGQYINLARGNLNVWSIGYQPGTSSFAISPGNVTDASFAASPYFTILNSNGNVGLGVASPAYQLELSTNSAAKPGSSSWTISSDARLKTDVKPFFDGLEVVKQIKPVTFRYNGKAGMPTDEEFVGIIAQDIQKIAPYMIGEWTYESKTGDAEKYLSYDANAMTYILINAIKEQQKQIEQLQRQNASIMHEMHRLKSGNASATSE